MYVAITRAREKLWLTRSRSRYLYGKREPTVRSEFVDELKDELGIEDVKARYAGDYGDYGEGYGYGSYGARRSSGYGGYGGYSGYGNYAPRRVGRASDEDEGAYRTFGSGSRPQRSAAKSVPSAKKEPLRFGNVGVRPAPSGTGSAANTAKPGADLSRFQEGARVRHPRFGDGVIRRHHGRARRGRQPHRHRPLREGGE